MAIGVWMPVEIVPTVVPDSLRIASEEFPRISLQSQSAFHSDFSTTYAL
jgi:hypothetical protein